MKNPAALLAVIAVVCSASALRADTSSNTSTNNVIGSIDVEGTGDRRTVRIHTHSDPTFTVFRLEDPMRVVVDISGGELGQLHGPLLFEDGVIGQVALRQFRSEGFTIGRLIIGFERPCGYDVQTDGHDVVLRTQPQGADDKPTVQGQLAPGGAPLAAQPLGPDAPAAPSNLQLQQDREAKDARIDALLAQHANPHPAKAGEDAAADPTEGQATADDTAPEPLVAAPVEPTGPPAPVFVEHGENGENIDNGGNAEMTGPPAPVPDAALIDTGSGTGEIPVLEGPVSASALTGIRKAGLNTFVLNVRGATDFKVQRLDEPARLVIDLPQVTRATARTSYAFRSALLSRVRLGDQAQGVRAVFDLPSSAVRSDVKAIPGGVQVALASPAESDTRPYAHLTPSPEMPPLGRVTDIKVKRDVNGLANVLLRVQGDVQAQVETPSPNTWSLRLDNASIADSLLKHMHVSELQTALTEVAVSSPEPGLVQVVASLGRPAHSTLRRLKNAWLWEIGSPQDPHSPAVAQSASVQTAGFAAEAMTLARSTPTQQRDSRRRISLDVKDADIINVLRLISEETGENIIASDDVKGKVTLKLRNVPADQALDTMLRTKGFDKVRQNNILRIAPAEAIQKERELELQKRRSLTEVEETLIKMVTVNYATAAEILDQIKPMLTARGSVQVDARTNTLILQDIASNIDRLVELARRLDKQTPLVMIQARIVEAATNHLVDLGVQWGGDLQRSSATGNPTGLSFPGDVRVVGGADDQSRNQVGGLATPARYAVNLPAQLGGAGGALGFILGSAGGSDLLNLRLSAMETNGNGKIISAPEVATLDNKTAKVSQGVEIPISVVSAAGTNTRFIPAVLELEVTPHVTNDGTVLLKIRTQKSTPDFSQRGAAGDPTIQKKYAETEVLVRDGDTSVIGGIYTRDTSETLSEVPFLARIPVLGTLFRQRRVSDNRAELLVFITPRIINREESMVQQGGPLDSPEPQENAQ